MAANQLSLNTNTNGSSCLQTDFLMGDTLSSSSGKSAGQKSLKNQEALKNQLNIELPPEESHLYLTEVIGLSDSTLMFTKHVLCCVFFNIIYALYWAWWPASWYKFRYHYVEEDTLDKADFVLVTDKKKIQTLCAVEMVRPLAQYESAMGIDDNTDFMQSDFHMDKMFVYRNRRYIYNPTTDMYELLHCPKYLDPATLDRRTKGLGLTQQEYVDNATLYGRNVLEIPTPGIGTLFINEFLQPFFCFQVYSVIVWLCEAYYTFAPVIAAMALASVCMSVYDTKSSLNRLKALAKHQDTIDVIRDGKRFTVDANELVIGDVVILKPGRVCCDMLVLRGSAVVNEAMLTGESLPIKKASEYFSMASKRVNIGNDRNTLYGGTTILQLKPNVSSEEDELLAKQSGAPPDPLQDEVLAMVTKAGYYTINGNLISSILFPEEPDFEFTKQTYKYLFVLFCLALVGFAWTVWRYTLDGASSGTIALRSLDLLTIVVPPSLPLAMSTAISFALGNLKKSKLFCINGSVIPIAGKVKICCYDKTGTLTTDTLVVRGVFSHLSSLSHKIHKDTVEQHHDEYHEGVNLSLQRDPSLIRNLSTIGELNSSNNADDDDDNDDDDDGVLDIPEPTPMNPEIVHSHCLPLIVREAIACCHSLAIDDSLLNNNHDHVLSINTDDSSHGNADHTPIDAFDRRELNRQQFVQSVVGDPLELAALDSVNATFVETPQAGVLFGVQLFPYKPIEQQSCSYPHTHVPVHDRSHVAPDIVPPCTCYNTLSNTTFSTQDVNKLEIPQTWYVLRVFAFDSSLQRMSVLALHLPSRELYVFTKGAPEVLFDMCDACYDDSPQYIEDYVINDKFNMKLTTQNANKTPRDYTYSKFAIGTDVKALNKRDLEQYNQLTTAKEREQFLLLSEHSRKVEEYSRCGYRVLGLALRKVSFEELLQTRRKPENTTPTPTLPSFTHMSDLSLLDVITTVNNIFNTFDLFDIRTQCEQQLQFCGLLVLENQLKPATKPTIHALSSAGVRCVMITGDNIRTAVAVSKECGIVLPQTSMFVSEIKLKQAYRKHPNAANIAKDVSPSTHEIIWRCSDNPRITLDPDTFKVICPPNVKTNFTRYELAVSGPALTLLIATENEQKSLLAAENGNDVDLDNLPPSGQSDRPLLDDTSSYGGNNPETCALNSPGIMTSPGTPSAQNNQYPLSPFTQQQTMSTTTSLSQYNIAGSVKSAGSGRSRKAGMKDSQSSVSATVGFPHLKSLDQVSKLQHVLLNAVCLARFKPDQKALAVCEYKKLGFITNACGDGANDTSMLRQAHVSISLSTTEASIAAPFTSQVTDISSTVTLLTEGRSTLASAFLLFRYMAMYSFVQFFCVILLYWYSGNLCDMQFLAQDLFSVFPLGVFMSRTPSQKSLTLKRPSGNLMSPSNLLGVFIHFLVNGILQYVMFIGTQWSWLSPNYSHPANPDNICVLPEATSLQYTNMFMYVYYAIIFALGPTARKWKKTIFINYWFLAALALSLTTSLMMLFLGPSKKWYIAVSYQDFPIDEGLKLAVVVWAFIGATVALVLENVVIPFIRWLAKQKIKSKRTNTIFGSGNNDMSNGAKPYHLLRSIFEANFKTIPQ